MPSSSRSLRKTFSLYRPWFAQINKGTMRADLIAGFTNAAIVLPQGVAFAIIAGLPPEYGLFTAMIPPIIAALFGSSMVMISGPTTAISAVLFASLSAQAVPGTAHYVEMALLLTILVGLIQLAAGLLRLGALITFISHSVIVGFTAAAALLIGASQLAPALGFTVERGGGVFERLIRVANSLDQTSLLACSLALFTLATLILCAKISRSLPNYLIALAGGSLLGWLLDAQVQGIAMFKPLDALLPSFHLPNTNWETIASLIPGAATIAFVGLLEAISIGRAFAIRRSDHYDSNQEIIGQALSNIVGGFFKCYAGSGSFTRSALNAETGAQTPLSGILAAFFLLLLLFVLAPFVHLIPIPVMAGIILYVAWRLINIGEIKHILTSSKSETVILLMTFLTGISTELEFAIIVGVIASLVVFLQKSANPHLFAQAPALYHGHRNFRSAHLYDLPQCPQIALIRIEGPLFFGSIEHVEELFREIEEKDGKKPVVIFNMRGVGNVDLAGADFLLKEMNAVRKRGGDFHMITTYRPVLRILTKAHVIEELGPDHIHPNKSDAIAAAVQDTKYDICATCTKRLFDECKARPAPKDWNGQLTLSTIQTLKTGI